MHLTRRRSCWKLCAEMSMSKLFFSSAFFVLALCVFPSELCARQLSARQVAALIEEITALRDEVDRLRMDVEDLRTENARLQESLRSKARSTSDAAEMASLRVEINNKFEAQRREIAADVEKRIARVNADVNAALSDMRKQVNAALDSVRTDKPAKPVTPMKQPSDLPAKGISYKVKAGDTLSKIARSQRSKIEWILFVNPGLDANRLLVGKEIVIPQAE